MNLLIFFEFKIKYNFKIHFLPYKHTRMLNFFFLSNNILVPTDIKYVFGLYMQKPLKDAKVLAPASGSLKS